MLKQNVKMLMNFEKTLEVVMDAWGSVMDCTKCNAFVGFVKNFVVYSP